MKRFLSFTQESVIGVLQKGGKMYLFSNWEVYLDDCDGNSLKIIIPTFNSLKDHRLIEAKYRLNENAVEYGLSEKGKELKINL